MRILISLFKREESRELELGSALLRKPTSCMISKQSILKIYQN
jgi:hypothetical protein